MQQETEKRERERKVMEKSNERGVSVENNFCKYTVEIKGKEKRGEASE